ncbi:hypothetical protein WAI453_000334 [Rhynchosporium graminicola]|uniref:RGS domain-containing protein n=1 Tax=Rhynchosporium graminicola TaxID=2792576 RepID=A0A1E1JQ79_9HELO|nr:uncharacterized protein RCO7_00922 [Rhynchosporium commune]
MSVLFYRRPNYLERPTGPINGGDCARYADRAKNSERKIPEGLSFDNVINNKALPPCSLNDFMDYLTYIEFNAENLQFYLWYKDYIRRWDALPESEKSLSPEFIPEAEEIPDLTKNSEKAERRKTKREASNALMDTGYLGKGSNFDFDAGCASPSILSAAPTLPSDAEVVAGAGLKWQGFSIQPMREEINRIMRHYLAFTAPRELNISHKDRAQCLHALQHTTHPSALAPAVNIAEAALRGQSHPNFIRWSICNGNKPRVFFVRTMGVSNIIIGFVIAIALTLSKASRWWRIFAALEWFIGISTMVAAYKGLCVIMHHSHARNLRPWEQDIDNESKEMHRNSFSSMENRAVQMASRIGDYNGKLGDEEDAASFRSSTMQTFGPKNCFDNATWANKYERKSLLRKVFDKQTWTQDETLRVLQDKIVLGANLWALIITIPLTIIFVAFPKGNFF